MQNNNTVRVRIVKCVPTNWYKLHEVWEVIINEDGNYQPVKPVTISYGNSDIIEQQKPFCYILKSDCVVIPEPEKPNKNDGKCYSEKGTCVNSNVCQGLDECMYLPKPEKVNEGEKADAVKRPPLGVIPKFIWQENRLQDLINAMGRYGIARYKIPEEWVTEYQELNDIVKHPHRTPKPEAWATDEDIRKAMWHIASLGFGSNTYSSTAIEHYLQSLKNKQL